MYLHAFVGNVIQHLGGKDLHHGALGGILFHGFKLGSRGSGLLRGRAMQAAFNEPHNAPHHRFRGKNADRHLCQLVLDRAEVSDRHPKSLPLLCVFDADGKNALGCAHHRRPQFEPADIQNIERDDMAAPDFSQHVFDRHLHVVKINGRGGAAPDAHLVLFRAAGEAAEGALNDERCKFFTTNFGEHDE